MLGFLSGLQTVVLQGVGGGGVFRSLKHSSFQLIFKVCQIGPYYQTNKYFLTRGLAARQGVGPDKALRYESGFLQDHHVYYTSKVPVYIFHVTLYHAYLYKPSFVNIDLFRIHNLYHHLMVGCVFYFEPCTGAWYTIRS